MKALFDYFRHVSDVYRESDISCSGFRSVYPLLFQSNCLEVSVFGVNLIDKVQKIQLFERALTLSLAVVAMNLLA